MASTINVIAIRSNRALRAASFAILAFGTGLAVAATPTSYFGSALITGTNNRISITRVPVINSAGTVTYKDLTINFVVDSAGTLTFGPSTIAASPSLIASGFKAGTYKDARGNKYSVGGPSVIPGTTRTAWSLALISGPDATQFSIGWVTGPIAGHPNQASLTARSITSTAYSWGIAGAETYISSSFPFYFWGDYGNVVGAAQAGNQISFHLFSNSDNIEDDSVSLQLCTTAC